MTKEFMNAVIEGKTFTGAELKNKKFSSVKLVGCNFAGVSLSGVKFDDVHIENCNFSNISLSEEEVEFKNCKIDSTLFSGAMKNFTFKNCKLVNTRFVGTLIDSNITSSKMSNIVLRNTKIYNCKFKETEFENVDFSNTKLKNVSGLDYYQFVENNGNTSLVILYIKNTDTVYLKANTGSVSMPLADFYNYIGDWEDMDTVRGLDAVVNLDRLKIINSYLVKFSEKHNQ